MPENLMVTRITIIGAGGHAKVVADAIITDGNHEISGFLDDDETLWGTELFGFPVTGPITPRHTSPKNGFVVGLGENATRKRFFDQFRAADRSPVTITHPRATIARDVRLGAGVVVFAGAVINSGTHIADNCILNTACIVDHDCLVEEHAHVGPGANIAGGVRICEGALIGLGANVIPGVQVGRWSVVGSGAVVTRSVDEGLVVGGIPARPIRQKAW